MPFPAAHQAFLDRAVPALQRDPRVRALVLAGSAATDTMDEWSDLDAIVVVEDVDAAWADHAAIVAALGPLLTAYRADHIAEPRLLMCLYDAPLLHVEVKFVATRDLPTLRPPTRVYWSRGPLPEPAPAAPPRPFDAQWCADRLPAWAHYLAAKLGRGELFEVASSLDFFRVRVLAPLVAVEAGARPRALRGLDTLDSPRLPQLARTLAPYDRAALADAAVTAIALARSLLDGHPEVRRHVEAEAKTVAYLAAVAAGGAPRRA